MSKPLFGRRMITTDETEVTIDNVVAILRKALLTHWKNRNEIEYLWNYYKGRQPILSRQKCIRPEIKNMIVENRANEIVSFKSGSTILKDVPQIWNQSASSLSFAGFSSAKTNSLSWLIASAMFSAFPRETYCSGSPIR